MKDHYSNYDALFMLVFVLMMNIFGVGIFDVCKNNESTRLCTLVGVMK